MRRLKGLSHAASTLLQTHTRTPSLSTSLSLSLSLKLEVEWRMLGFLCGLLHDVCPSSTAWLPALLRRISTRAPARILPTVTATAEKLDTAAAARAGDEGVASRCTRTRRGGEAHAVGQIRRHRRYGYTCVIVGWDHTNQASEEWQEQMRISSLPHGADQPFYSVLDTVATATCRPPPFSLFPFLCPLPSVSSVHPFACLLLSLPFLSACLSMWVTRC